MNLFKILLLAIALCNLSSQRMASFRPGKDLAVFFAVQDYDKWGKLRNPIKDAEAIAKELKDLYGFDTLIVRNPTKNQIYDKLEAYRQRKYAEDAQLLVFFSGHGDFDAATQEGFFIPKDGKLQDIYQDSYLPHTRLERQINSIPCKHILLAIDACYSGTFDKAIALSRDGGNFARPGAGDVNQQRPLFIDRALKYQSRLYLTSGAKERTPDPSEFARQFLAGLRSFGGDDQVLTFSELCGYMEKANPTPRFGEFEGNEPGGNFLFILKEATPATAPPTTTRTPIQEPPRSVDKAQLSMKVDSFSTNTLLAGKHLIQGQKIYAANGLYYLIVQTDCSVVIYDADQKPIWDSQTKAPGNCNNGKLSMQEDGNLVLYDGQNKALWSSKTHPYFNLKFSKKSNRPVKAVLENTGAFVLYTKSGEIVWSSK